MSARAPDGSDTMMTPVQRAAARWCLAQGWAPLTEAPLPDGLRADILALTADARFIIIEAKSGARDFATDRKWPGYRGWCDAFYFAVDLDFPQALLPPDAGLLVTDGTEASMLRAAPDHALALARRRSLLLRFGLASARRLAAMQDPAAQAALFSALRAE
jgi:hypothetical protein